MSEQHPIEPNQPTQRPDSSRLIPLGVVVGISALVLLTGGGAAWWTWQSVTSQTPSAPVEQDTTPPQISPQPAEPDPVEPPVAAEQTVQVYWLSTLGTEIEPIASPVTVQGEQPEEILTAAFERMLEGSADPDLTSTIPSGTTLESLNIETNGVYVDLSQEFVTGGGSASMVGRLAQVVYTATTLDPEAPVWISVAGQPLEVLGGEGILVDQPMTRTSFEQEFPM
ncbi:GerMN domain-containing protein [Egbenema bharatensis]|uniref:GerMN domain-containing protein n=1 Tax=Egbenema bharatensis TaxID=3463334 RepID=UPI003A8A6A50